MKELLTILEKTDFTPKTFSTKWTYDNLLGKTKLNKGSLVNKDCENNLLSEIQKWLRDTYNIIVQPECNYWDKYNGWNTYSVTIHYALKTKSKDITKCFYKTYEESLEIGLKVALKLVKL